MGVPTFYRWLCQKWPKVVLDVVEEREKLVSGGVFAPVDLEEANPNGIEFDNLYIDMNGVVHPCAHPEDGEQPGSEAEMFQNVCDYIDRLVQIVRPRKFLYLCLDGVAPQAKMNQQRSRRYKAAMESERSEVCWEEMTEEWRRLGKVPPPRKTRWDSNVITPGTDFMDRLAYALRYYVARRMKSSTYWQSLVVLVSDSNVPGEGEHKVMRYVREMRGINENPNTVHCIHGMDADLIMLGLSTHETHFYIIREIVTDGGGNRERNKPSYIKPDQGPGLHSDGVQINKSFRATWKPLQILQLPVLREYLKYEFKFDQQELITQHSRTGHILRLTSDLERHIDDFVFLCFLVGNDFLPHLPSLSIHQGSIDQMLALYKHTFPQIGGYLTDEGAMQVDQVQNFLRYIAKAEPKIFEDSVRRKEQQDRRNEQQRAESAARKATEVKAAQEKVDLRGAESEAQQWSAPNRWSAGGTATQLLPPPPNATPSDVSEVSRVSRMSEGSATELEAPPVALTDEASVDFARALTERQKSNSQKHYDEDSANHVALGQGDVVSYRRDYYMKKFGARTDEEVEKMAEMASRHFVRGLQWVLLYYKRGVPSWSWYYPFYFAPLAMDMFRYGFMTAGAHACAPPVEPFSLGAPVNPLEQLLAVLPPRSASFLPAALQDLMVSPTSPLKDFYPSIFHEDTDGKKQSWQWTAILPFINMSRLQNAVAKVQHFYNENEIRRNRAGAEYLFTGAGLLSSSNNSVPAGDGSETAISLNGVCGTVRAVREAPLPMQGDKCCLPFEGFQPFIPDACIMEYERPKQLHPRHAHSSLMPGAVPAPPRLTDQDLADKPPSRGRGMFNVNAAIRIIMHVIGGKALREYEAKEEAARDAQYAQRINAANIIDIHNAPNPLLTPKHTPAADQGNFDQERNHRRGPPHARGYPVHNQQEAGKWANGQSTHGHQTNGQWSNGQQANGQWTHGHDSHHQQPHSHNQQPHSHHQGPQTHHQGPQAHHQGQRGRQRGNPSTAQPGAFQQGGFQQGGFQQGGFQQGGFQQGGFQQGGFQQAGFQQGGFQHNQYPSATQPLTVHQAAGHTPAGSDYRQGAHYRGGQQHHGGGQQHHGGGQQHPKQGVSSRPVSTYQGLERPAAASNYSNRPTGNRNRRGGAASSTSSARGNPYYKRQDG
ncbi:putative 5'-3' exoribonuclease [Gregarina niphandrodes]|uniref:5'-3' exoribonuclease n=1 Tax=Gregarina niphandrodes TaxID=110365 RepID=A0A023B566_GRENI|nr:putative 5'-3' exoribonuclease [Gregarina niphandrodes]EZG58884.1 putative 5'-3' exoribonuclease [Gregarina niphandrodes]|eukprot:XP_011130939.1 putative 5'-3' exoribonuclease [Gregarina niphandrodes]